MTTMIPTEPGAHAPGVTDQESNLELKEIEGLSQGQIVRKRFFRHRGALVSMVVLALIIITAFTSVGVQFGTFKSGGWWIWSWNTISPIVNGGRPTLSLWPFAIGDHPFGQDEVGRDIFALVMRGTQQSLMIMVVVGLLSTVIFAASHLEPLRTSLLIVIALPIGIARLITRRLTASVVAHVVNNFLPGLTFLLVGLGVMS